MPATATSAEAMFLNTYYPQEQQMIVGEPPLSTLASYRSTWPELGSPRASRAFFWVVSDAPNNTLSTVHLVIANQAVRESPDADPAITADSMIARAQTVTGLSLKDLAKVYGVSRQTLYNYKKQTDQPNDTNWQRLQKIDKEIAELEQIFPASPGALAKRVANDQGETLLSLLQQERPSSDRLKALAHKLAEHMASAAPSKHHQNTLDELTRHC